MNGHLISLMVFLPLVGALLQAFVPNTKGASRWLALASSLGATICGLAVVFSMASQTPELQARETLPWIGSYAISYDMGVDGLNALLILLVAIVFPILIAFEWNQKISARGMHGLFLVLQSSFFGVVCAQDIFLQFFFWALSALPFYFLIGIWGGEGRETAALRSMVAAAIGNALLFSALVLVYYSVDPHTFLLSELAGGKLNGKTFALLGQELSVPIAAFALIGLGLALRAPIWPFHGWFTRVAEEAPASVFVALCAVSVPVACYMFIRLCYSLFPETTVAFADVIVAIGIINLLAGGVCAAAQQNLRVLLAFICLNEVGLILIGVGSLNQAGVVGAVFQQLVLGIALAGFGLFSGVVSQRAGESVFAGDKAAFGGIASKAPTAALVAGIVIASLLGFPGSGGFVGHALLVIGSFSVHPVTVLLAGAALLLATYYLFTMYRLVFLGRPRVAGGVEAFPDLTLRERAYLLPLVGALLLFGFYPKPLLDLVRPTVMTLLSTVK